LCDKNTIKDDINLYLKEYKGSLFFVKLPIIAFQFNSHETHEVKVGEILLCTSINFHSIQYYHGNKNVFCTSYFANRGEMENEIEFL